MSIINVENISKICLISDTHMHLNNSAIEALCGQFNMSQIYDSSVLYDGDVDDLNNFFSQKDDLNKKIPEIIVHAGDIGRQEIIDALEQIAPVVAVNGNCDFYTFKTTHGETKDFDYFNFFEVGIAVSHKPDWLDSYIDGSFLRPSQLPKGAKKPNLRIHGHTHESNITNNGNGFATICPGSATQGRYGTPNSIANVYLTKTKLLYAELIEI